MSISSLAYDIFPTYNIGTPINIHIALHKTTIHSSVQRTFTLNAFQHALHSNPVCHNMSIILTLPSIIQIRDSRCAVNQSIGYMMSVVALHCTYMFVLTCSFTVRSVYFRTSPANVSVHFSLEMHLEHSYHCVVFLSVHSSNSTLVLFCLVTLSKPSFSSITTALPGSSLFAPTRARAKTTISIFGYLAQTFEVLQHVCSIENHQQQEEAIQAFQVF